MNQSSDDTKIEIGIAMGSDNSDAGEEVHILYEEWADMFRDCYDKDAQCVFVWRETRDGTNCEIQQRELTTDC